MFDHEIAKVLHRQAGVISFQQAKEIGLSRAKVRYREQSGAWIRVARGVYRVAIYPKSERTMLWIGVLTTGGLVSHQSAARLHHFDGLVRRGTMPEVSVAHGRWRRVPGVVVHQTTQFNGIDEVRIDGLPCTGRGRTVLDLGASMKPRQLGKVVDRLLRDKAVTMAELWDVLIRHSVQGRNGCGPLRIVLELRRGQQRIALSDWSYMVANLLESAGLPRPRLEFRAHSRDGRFLAQIDLAYPEAMLAIELDSVGWHNNLDSFESDRSRARGLTVEGWSVLQFTWKTYSEHPDQLIAQVSEILRPLKAAG